MKSNLIRLIIASFLLTGCASTIKVQPINVDPPALSLKTCNSPLKLPASNPVTAGDLLQVSESNAKNLTRCKIYHQAWLDFYAQSKLAAQAAAR